MRVLTATPALPALMAVSTAHWPLPHSRDRWLGAEMPDVTATGKGHDDVTAGGERPASQEPGLGCPHMPACGPGSGPPGTHLTPAQLLGILLHMETWGGRKGASVWGPGSPRRYSWGLHWQEWGGSPCFTEGETETQGK